MEPNTQLAVAIAAVAEVTGINGAQILGCSRDQAVCRARWMCSRLLFLGGKSYAQIGRLLDTDYKSVKQGIRRLAEIASADPCVADEVDRIDAHWGQIKAQRADEMAQRAHLTALAVARLPKRSPSVVSVCRPSPLSEQGLARMKQLRREGWSDQGLSRQFGLPVEVVRKLIGVEHA